MAGVTSKPYKIFNDPIHGSIEMHPYLVRIIDTPEFQRLRYIRQMGSVYFVYPGASHNRFEHSIGVAHLAGELVQALNRQYLLYEDPELKALLYGQTDESKPLITEEEGLCVQIAALCHDLGHGPFSHQFDDLFIPKVVEKLSTELEKEIPDGEKKREKKNTLENWTHEEQSGSMLKILIGNISDTECRAFIDTHKDFIKELIDPPGEIKHLKNPKTFLYEIVSNKRNGIDVDKMDYFSRDCYHLGIESNFNCGRFFKFARVCVCDGEMQICMRDKEVGHIYDLYHTRSNIHHKACQHKVVSAIDTMIVDALLLADEALNISGSVSEPIEYRKLKDVIYQDILHCEKIKFNTEYVDDINKAQKILERIESRNLYKCIYDCRLKDKNPDCENKNQRKRKHENELEHDLQQEYEELPQVEKKNFAVRIINLASGKKGEDPIKHMKFYSKQHPCTAKKLKRKEVSQLLPNVFSETVLQIFCKNSETSGNMQEFRASDGFQNMMKEWCEKNHYEMVSE